MGGGEGMGGEEGKREKGRVRERKIAVDKE